MADLCSGSLPTWDVEHKQALVLLCLVLAAGASFTLLRVTSGGQRSWHRLIAQSIRLGRPDLVRSLVLIHTAARFSTAGQAAQAPTSHMH